MAEEFDHLLCPMCGSKLLYSEVTHDLGFKNNPRSNESGCWKNDNCLHKEAVTYDSGNSRMPSSASGSMSKILNNSINFSGYKLCDSKKYGSENSNNNVCEMPEVSQDSSVSDMDKQTSDLCFFGMSFTESAYKGRLWSIRIVVEKLIMRF